jgi:hypothetical protein
MQFGEQRRSFVSDASLWRTHSPCFHMTVILDIAMSAGTAILDIAMSAGTVTPSPTPLEHAATCTASPTFPPPPTWVFYCTANVDYKFRFGFNLCLVCFCLLWLVPLSYRLLFCSIQFCILAVSMYWVTRSNCNIACPLQRSCFVWVNESFNYSTLYR